MTSIINKMFERVGFEVFNKYLIFGSRFSMDNAMNLVSGCHNSHCDIKRKCDVSEAQSRISISQINYFLMFASIVTVIVH